MKLHTFIMTLVLSLGLSTLHAQSQAGKIKIAVLNIESTELMQTPELLGKMARLKIQKDPKYSVFREHDVKEHYMNDMDRYNTCYSIQCMTEVGKELGADQVLSGSAERFGERIVINLVIVDVKTGTVIASDVNEYYKLGGELEGMIEISVNNLLGRETDPLLVNGLVQDETVLRDQVVEKLNLNGPRMGASYIYGLRGRRMQDPTEQDGLDALPVISQFGYQFEWQYLSAGDLQALVEVIPLIGGMDQGMFIPSITLMNGFRHNRSGIEFAFGPTFRMTKTAWGFYDENNEWRHGSEYVEELADTYKSPKMKTISRNGNVALEYAFTLAAGKTIKSGHLNIPINVFYSPSKNGGVIGASFCFNIRRPK